MNFNVTFTFTIDTKATCFNGHPLQQVTGRWAMCDNCQRCGINPSWACIRCNFDLCRDCAQQNVTTQKSNQTVTNYNYVQSFIPTGQEIRLFDGNHQTHLFIGNSTEENDHTAYACQQKLFSPENFPRRTSFVITLTNEGYYQIMDTDHQAFLFVGNGVDNGGDHTVYACPQKHWKDYNDFMFRTSFSFVQADGGVRILDRKHGSYIFVGNADQGGDHTLYSVPVQKFNNNRNEWEKRTLFKIEGGKYQPIVPTFRLLRLLDSKHSSHIFVGNPVDDSQDHKVYSCQKRLFQPENWVKRTGVVIQPTQDGFYQIYDTDKNAFFFVGNGVDEGGDHNVWACEEKFWKSHDDFMLRTAFTIQPAGDGYWRILDRKHNSYIFVGNGEDGGDHTVYSVPVSKYNSNPGEWEFRTLWKFE